MKKGTLGIGRDVSAPEEESSNRERCQGLQGVLPARRESFAVLVLELAPVIDETDRAEARGHEQHGPDIAVGQVGPQQGRDHERNQDQGAAHGRRAGLAQVRLRTQFADGLADLPLGHVPDEQRTDEE